jgi:hypothetical protein
MEKQPLDGWIETTLWFQIGINDPCSKTFRVLSPPNCSEKDYVKLLEKSSSQIVALIRKLTGAHDMIVQGQRKERKTIC